MLIQKNSEGEFRMHENYKEVARGQFSIQGSNSGKSYVVIDASTNEQAMQRFSAVRQLIQGLPHQEDFEAVPLLQNTVISVAWFKEGFFKAAALPPTYAEKSTTGDPRLVQLLIEKASIKGHSIQEMCDRLLVTLGFFNQLRNGKRKTEDIGEELLVEIAAYLEVPVGDIANVIKRI